VLFPVCGTCIVLWLAFHPSLKFHGFSKHGDFSYGMYLYAFPIQQLLVMSCSGSMNPYALFALAWPLSIVAGMFSWYFVERPFLRRTRSEKGNLTLTVAAQPS
jgi:peptidoglycan/LPS O-acetylase OafA/YrhL